MDGKDQEGQIPPQKLDFTAPGTEKKDYKKFDPEAPASKWKKPALITLAVLVIAGAAVAVYWFVLKPKPVTKEESPAVIEKAEEADNSDKIATTTELYSSPQFLLEFNYPNDWKVTDEPGSGFLYIRSPEMQLTDASGGTVTGQIVLIMRTKVQKLPEFDKGNATALKESEKLAYAKPSQSQRANTYISYLSYAGGTGGLDGVFVTGDSGYTKDQAIPKADIEKVDPIITITFTSEGKPIGILESAWDKETFNKPLKTMLQSLVVN